LGKAPKPSHDSGQRAQAVKSTSSFATLHSSRAPPKPKRSTSALSAASHTASIPPLLEYPSTSASNHIAQTPTTNNNKNKNTRPPPSPQPRQAERTQPPQSSARKRPRQPFLEHTHQTNKQTTIPHPKSGAEEPQSPRCRSIDRPIPSTHSTQQTNKQPTRTTK
jgi:hypothetical protein